MIQDQQSLELLQCEMCKERLAAKGQAVLLLCGSSLMKTMC